MAVPLPPWVKAVRIVIMVLCLLVAIGAALNLFLVNPYQNNDRGIDFDFRNDSVVVLLSAAISTFVILLTSFYTNFLTSQRSGLISTIVLTLINILWLVGWAWGIEQTVHWVRLLERSPVEPATMDWVWVGAMGATAGLGAIGWFNFAAMIYWSATHRSNGTSLVTDHQHRGTYKEVPVNQASV
ncbi:hypothetical protein B0I35DRAFT_4603 [Stachybotrys elegans]|uniref:MARVEL domain-containing protein n=1 Tax=Stachybotrys elegans TaxID=80388 RepID=A0A8K0T0D3_9HYPO|nr:hypothetical protein B0I35DRAFT_4603 [Stachybotrys elegans]